LAVLGQPIIRLIFEHGRFSPHATVETARALSGYAVGLASYAAIKVAAPAFYALGRTRVPLVASLSAVGANLLWNVLTFRHLGHVGLALGTSLAATVNLTVLLVAFQVQIRQLITAAFLGTVVRILTAAAVMGAAIWPLERWLSGVVPAGTGGAAVTALVPVGVGAAVYFLAARTLGVGEASTLLRRYKPRS